MSSVLDCVKRATMRLDFVCVRSRRTHGMRGEIGTGGALRRGRMWKGAGSGGDNVAGSC